MLKKIAALAIVFAVVISLITFATAQDITPQEAAEVLNTYNLFMGTDLGYELNRTPTRLEAIVMAVRLTGNEEWAVTEDWANPDYGTHSFEDVPAWADGYVSCACYIGLTEGMSETEFGSFSPVSAEQYATMLLRVLGYKDSYGHFRWDDPWELSDHIGLTDGFQKDGTFTRGDMAKLSYIALGTKVKNQSFSLYYYSFVYKRPQGNVNEEAGELFNWGDDNICLDRFDTSEYITVSETAYGSIMFSGEGVLREDSFVIENFDSSVATCEIEYLDEDFAHIYIVGLREGHTTLKITFADRTVAPHAIGFIDVFVEASA
jgi:hypothetical protein